MSTLLRLLTILVVLAGVAYGGMWALATFVAPAPHQERVALPAARLAGKSGEVPLGKALANEAGAPSGGQTP